MWFGVYCFFCLTVRRPPRAQRTDPLWPYTTLCRAARRRIVALRLGFAEFAVDHHAAAAALAAGRRRAAAGHADMGRDPPGDQMKQQAAQRRQEQQNCDRSEEHTSELQSLMRNSYAGFCLKKKPMTDTKTQQPI